MGVFRYQRKKKAVIIDIFFMSFLLLLFAIIGLIMYKVMTDVDTQMADDTVIDEEYRNYVTDYKTKLPSVLQQLFMLLLIGITILTIISAFLVMSHPIFYAFMIIILAFMVWVNSIYANLWQDFSSDSVWGSLVNDMPMINFALQYFPLIMLIISLIIVIIMVSKNG